ncbi:type VI secretion system baseplate subunit TssF [Burkholderia ubonensis]|uniref:type VI secretion system baseplate subunit TssF n=1 Tax=Burkholderia ubonensis TaxID=101571 RepID=UPI000F56DA1C|nr:type VI secretion system baseplate subunit TssF [Burkholderia ubonensis]RQP36513.1 type VI secretion system baseplate subunit TssF [Burkholderia ubonensis]RQP46655.1 type VI secretion system baseplate subunit TssF [Burkholderia ubonensis]RQP47624.1 type VI secretion system baseplate subunit TssF [Burkholderia ubonensis]RQP61660.1 type VI secretion system baseplate subunit TssF [Burkholderia ubonensis]RQP61884.1 type VI secretion system baseplate subunit TssF [Burkholderia ubonensis]
MKNLLPHYEYEVGLLMRGLTDFTQRYPKIGARLGIANGQGDLHVDRMVQTFALLAARVDAKLEDAYPEFTESLLEVLYPQYLRTVPACAIAQFDPTALFGQLTAPFRLSRGTSLDANAAPCRFRTVYDVALAPLRIQAARHAPATLVPAAVRLPADVTGILSITFASATASETFDDTIPSGSLRVHLSGDRPRVAAVTDALLLRACAAFVEVDQSGRWNALSKVPIKAVGFDENEQLLPVEPAGTSSAFQTLIEYFAFPEKFDFIDIDLGRMRRAASAPHARQLTLHVAIHGTVAGSSAAQALNDLDAAAFKLFCTPVVNLFKRNALPIQLTDAATAYSVTPEPLETGVPLDIYSIDAVYLGDRTQSEQEKAATLASQTPRTTVLPYRAFSHGRPLDPAIAYWTAFRDPYAGAGTSRPPLLLSLVSADGDAVQPKRPQVDVDVTATNGELPSRLPIGAPDSDLLHEGAALACPIRLLTRPTLPSTLPRGHDALWRVLAGMSLHPFDLTQTGLKAFKDFLRLHAPRGNVLAQHSIDAITDLDYRPAMKWMALDSQFPSFVRGVEIVVLLDEGALRDVTLNLFAQVLDRFFAPYAPTNSYVQLVIRSAQTGQELQRCPAQPGTRPLI